MKTRSKLKTLLRMVGLVKPLSGLMILAVLAGTLGFLAAQFIPILGGFTMLTALGYSQPFTLSAIMVALPTLAILRAVFRLMEQRINHYIAFKLLAIIRDRIFQALRKLCPAKLEVRDKGDLISLITSDVELLEVFYAHTISPICIALLTTAAMVLFIGSWHWSLGLLTLMADISIGVIIPAAISKRSGTLGDALRAQSGELATYMLENIRGLDEILQYACGEKRRSVMNRKTDEFSNKQSELNLLTGTNTAITNTMILVFNLAMLLLAGSLHRNGVIGFDGFLIPLIALLSSFGPVTALANLGTALQTTIAAAARVLSLIDEIPVTEEIRGKENTVFSGASCQNVSFSYEKELILDDISVSFPENRIIGIVGKSGCGKSTLLKLLMRFWKLHQGNIEISGKDIAEINTADLRNMESYMTQETQLFRDTISNNIRIGKLDASEEEIQEACRKAALHDFIITLPHGYNSQVGELGETLSGGERQRIGLARAFLHEAPFMLLDEPTSNLDSLNEAIILRSLKEESKGKAIALVSHRKSTVRIANEVVTMEDGRT